MSRSSSPPWSRAELQARVARACGTAPYEIAYGYYGDARPVAPAPPATPAVTYTVVVEPSVPDPAAGILDTLARHVGAEEALDLQETYNHDPKVDEDTYAVILDDRDSLPACMVELGMAGGAAGCECHRCEAKRAAEPALFGEPTPCGAPVVSRGDATEACARPAGHPGFHQTAGYTDEKT